MPNQAPTMLYGGEALAEGLVDASLGATKRLIEWLEYDDEFFASMGAGEALPEVEGEQPAPPVAEAAEPEVRTESPRPEAPRRVGAAPRDRRRGRRPRDGQPEGSESASETTEETAEPAVAKGSPVESPATGPVASPAAALPVESSESLPVPVDDAAITVTPAQGELLLTPVASVPAEAPA